MNIVSECGAVKAPLSPIEWRISDRSAVLELRAIAGNCLNGYQSEAQSLAEFGALFDAGRIGARSARAPEPGCERFEISDDDVRRLFFLAVDCAGERN